MIYPTITCSKRKTHAVYDENSCLCGLNFRSAIPKTQKGLFKVIHFKDINSINCDECRLILKMKAMSLSNY